MENNHLEYPKDKIKLYPFLYKHLRELIKGETYPVSNMANCSALLYDALDDVNWVGFYIVRKVKNEKILQLGPFQGKTACLRIPFGKGVCGKAALEEHYVLVKNVHEFPGHIACDCDSNSEIVIPLYDMNNNLIAVMDIDSPVIGRFDEDDRDGLQGIARILESGCMW